MQKKNSLLLILLPFFLALAGCEEEKPISLAETSWMLQVKDSKACDTPPTLEFTGNKVSGDLGCNLVHGNYSLKGRKIHFDHLAVTKRLCAPEIMAVEEKMITGLNNAVRCEKKEKSLTFFDAKGHVLLELVPEVLGACRH